MKNLMLGVGVALTAALSTTLGLTEKVSARPIDSGSSFLVAQIFSEPVQSSDTLTPTLKPIDRVADYYAFVDSFDGQTLYVRLPDGELKPFVLPEGVGGVDEYNLNPNTLVGISANKNDEITGLNNPVIDTEFTGIIESIDENNVMLARSVTGEEFSTPLSERVAAMFEPGDEVKANKFQGEGLESLTSVCKIKRAAVEPPIPEPIPVAPEPIPAPPPVVEAFPALW